MDTSKFHQPLSAQKPLEVTKGHFRGGKWEERGFNIPREMPLLAESAPGEPWHFQMKCVKKLKAEGLLDEKRKKMNNKSKIMYTKNTRAEKFSKLF